MDLRGRGVPRDPRIGRPRNDQRLPAAPTGLPWIRLGWGRDRKTTNPPPAPAGFLPQPLTLPSGCHGGFPLVRGPFDFLGDSKNASRPYRACSAAEGGSNDRSHTYGRLGADQTLQSRPAQPYPLSSAQAHPAARGKAQPSRQQAKQAGRRAKPSLSVSAWPPVVQESPPAPGSGSTADRTIPQPQTPERRRRTRPPQAALPERSAGPLR